MSQNLKSKGWQVFWTGLGIAVGTVILSPLVALVWAKIKTTTGVNV